CEKLLNENELVDLAKVIASPGSATTKRLHKPEETTIVVLKRFLMMFMRYFCAYRALKHSKTNSHQS
ncbi:MAG: hypothetical protein AAFW67_13085, partial [Cyanobacteria bacterium J06638_38]